MVSKEPVQWIYRVQTLPEHVVFLYTQKHVSVMKLLFPPLLPTQ